MPQPPRLVVMPGSKRVAADLLGDAGPIVDHPDLAPCLRSAPTRRIIVPLRPCSASIAFFTSDSSAHSSSTGSPSTVGPIARRLQPELDRVGAARQPRPEVAADAVGQRAEADRLALGRVADPLEPPGHPVEPLRVGREVVGELAGGVGRRAHPLDPALEAGERRAHLVRGLARHRHPEAVPLRRHRAPVGEDRDRDHHGDGERLQDASAMTFRCAGSGP